MVDVEVLAVLVPVRAPLPALMITMDASRGGWLVT